MDDKVSAALNACVVHARDLLASAHAVHNLGHYGIAYHLGTLCLEELGRRQMLFMQAVHEEFDKKGLPKEAVYDHVKKLFWCLWLMEDVATASSYDSFLQATDLAQHIHSNRLAGLYVDVAPDGLNIPSRAISPEHSAAHLKLADALVSVAENQPPGEVSPNNKELQAWFMRALDDPEYGHRIINVRTIEKMKELNDVGQWVRWLREEIQTEDEKLDELMRKELTKTPIPGQSRQEDKWRVRLRIETHAHSIRASALKEWNEAADWLKFIPVQGAKNKSELIVEITLDERVPLGRVFDVSLNFARLVLIALNFATSGFWWFSIQRHRFRFYDKIEDLTNGLEVRVDNDELKVFWDRRPALTKVHVQNFANCLSALPSGPGDSRAPPYGFFLGALTYISLSDVHLRFEDQAFVNLVQCLHLLLVEAKYIKADEAPSAAIARVLKERYPDLDQDEYDKLIELIEVLLKGRAAKVSMGDVYMTKLLCEDVFREFIVRKKYGQAMPSMRFSANEGDAVRETHDSPQKN